MRRCQGKKPLTQTQRQALASDLLLTYIAPRIEPTAVRARSLREAARFGSTLTGEDARTRSYASLLPAALKHAEQLEREELPGYTARALIRERLAEKIEREVLPLSTARWLERYPMRLRTARQSGSYGVTLDTGRPVVFWDAKAGLSRLCPDDAREESMRLQRRYAPTLEAWTECSRTHRLTYMVFTKPNSARGSLRAGMEKIFADLKRIVLKSGEFPAIKGALAVLEAPLGAARDWNVHLNVLVMHDGFVDWGKLRRLWHWNVHMQALPRAPGAIGAALRELIKYAVAATVAKSEYKGEAHVGIYNPDARGAGGDTRSGVGADIGSDGQLSQHPAAGACLDHSDVRAGDAAPGRHAPPMLRWSGAEVLEWLEAFHLFRRTRSYGALYDLEAPEPEALGPVAWLGRIQWHGGRYWHRLALLDSILEDKSALDEGPQDRRTSWQRFRHRLKLDHLAPIGELTMTVNDIHAAIEQNPRLDRS